MTTRIRKEKVVIEDNLRGLGHMLDVLSPIERKVARKMIKKEMGEPKFKVGDIVTAKRISKEEGGGMLKGKITKIDSYMFFPSGFDIQISKEKWVKRPHRGHTIQPILQITDSGECKRRFPSDIDYTYMEEKLTKRDLVSKKCGRGTSIAKHITASRIPIRKTASLLDMLQRKVV